MSDHGKKKIAPVVVTAVLLIYYGVYFGFIISILPGIWKVITAVIPLLIGATTIYVCIQRLKEIDGGEEDDLGKY